MPDCKWDNLFGGIPPWPERLLLVFRKGSKQTLDGFKTMTASKLDGCAWVRDRHSCTAGTRVAVASRPRARAGDHLRSDGRIGDDHMRELTAAFTVAAACILTAACGGGGNEDATSSTPSTPASPTTSTSAPPTTSTPPPPVTEAALDGLLLSPAEIDTAVGATGMAVAGTSTSLAEDITVPPDAPEEKVACVGIAGTAESQAYAGSGSTAVRDQVLQAPSDNGAPLSAGQAVVLLPTADEAATFFGGSAQKWPLCRGYNAGGSPVTVGDVSNEDGMLATSITIQNENEPDSLCERALTVKNNVAIDVSTCGGSSDSAVKIANQIAAKVPGQ